MPLPSQHHARSSIIEQMLNTLERVPHLSKWEEDFLASLSDQFEQTRTLSDRQFETLEHIYTEKAS